MTITIPAWLLWGAGAVLVSVWVVFIGLAILGGMAIAAEIFFSDLWR